MKEPMEKTLQRNILIACGLLGGIKARIVADKFDISIHACRLITTRMVRRIDEHLYTKLGGGIKNSGNDVIPLKRLWNHRNRLRTELKSLINLNLYYEDLR